MARGCFGDGVRTYPDVAQGAAQNAQVGGAFLIQDRHLTAEVLEALLQVGTPVFLQFVVDLASARTGGRRGGACKLAGALQVIGAVTTYGVTVIRRIQTSSAYRENRIRANIRISSLQRQQKLSKCW